MTTTQAIPITQLTESPTNPRKRYGDLNQLADSIRSVGVLQPITVRPAGDTDHPDKTGPYQIVFGHRRYRAAKLAKLKEIPAIVRELSNTEALELQVVENCQRADIHPLEEADAYASLLASSQITTDELAAKLGKSRTSVYDRLKLRELQGEAVREAFLADKFGASVAMLIARIPKELQDQALEAIKDGDGVLSYRDARWELTQRFTLLLKGAPFKTGDAELITSAGPCTTCPKRSGNQPELFGDVDRPDVCTDPTCYRDKAEAAWERAEERHRSKGLEVIQDTKETKALFPYGGSHLVSRDYLDAEAICHQDPKLRTYKRLLGRKAETILVRDGEGRPRHLLKRSGLGRALKDAGHKLKETTKSQASNANPDSTKIAKLTVRLGNQRVISEASATKAAADYLRRIVRMLEDDPGTGAQDYDQLAADIGANPWDSGAAMLKELEELTLTQLKGLLCGMLLPRAQPWVVDSGAYADTLKIWGFKLAELKRAAKAEIARDRKEKAAKKAKPKGAKPARKKAAKKAKGGRSK